MLPPAGISACPWEHTMAGQEADGGVCHPATVPRPQGASPCPWQPGVLGMEQSTAPLEGGQGWRCPQGHSRNTAWLQLVPAPFAFAPPDWHLGPPDLRRGYPTASLSDPAGSRLPPWSSPPPALWVSPCLEAKGGSQMHRGGCRHPVQAALLIFTAPSRPAPLAG